jgi:hypothetical protein
MTAMTVNSNSLLAKLLATENITVQHKSGIKTAMFDLKNRVLMLPMWHDISQDLEHLLIGHETAHAIDTPSGEEYKKAYEDIANRVFGSEVSDQLKRTVQGFVNVIEDVRIDKRQKRRYPGLRRNYLAGYKELIDRDFFGTKGRDINSMNFIDRVNVYFKGGNINLNIEFTPEERVLLKQIENIETFAEVVEVAEKVYRFCKDKIENDIHNDLGLGESEDGDKGDSYDIDDFSDDADDWDGDLDGDDSEEDAEDGEGDEGEGKSDAVKGEGDIGDNGSGNTSDGAGASSDEIKAPESYTDRVWEEKVQELVKDDNTDYVYVTLPDVNWDKAIHDYKRVLSDWRRLVGAGYYGHFSKKTFEEGRAAFNQWRQKEKDSISFLVKEFEQRKAAEMYSRISVAKTGVIDTNKLHSYKFNDDIFRRLTTVPEGKNHGFIMFLDWSGSMDRNLKYTLRQLFTLVLFCKQIQVPFEVYAFKDSGAENPFSYLGKENVIGLGNVVLRQFLSSKMTLAELNEAMTFLSMVGGHSRLYTDGLGGTPLNEAVILAPKIINDFRAKHKLEIVNTIFLTDGESNGLGGIKNCTGVQPGRKVMYKYVDKSSGKTYDISLYGWGDGANTTNKFLKMLKDQTDCNLIGFFLSDSNIKRFLSRFGMNDGTNYHYVEKVVKFWKENKFYPVKNEGYDEYYVINSNVLRETENELEIDNTKSTKSMAKAFSKFAAKKSINRVLLRQFINNVTQQSKKIA